ncbi:hypothetical protein OUZ56_000240 [Daphnia magna]|uniref:Uncharacterized protein n=1 Tax=Daphnia magna TaxID=35525 RepID=A0ABQ9ZZ25_9CRUS|nr:hypothetical protein OUZ56_000240 [Daphnia magna]
MKVYSYIKASFGMLGNVTPSLALLSTSLVVHNMKILIVLAFCVAVISTGTPYLSAFTHAVRVPSRDSAVIRSDRLGGNFAYSTIEGHAYVAVAPILQHTATPTDAMATPMISNNDPTSAYALESATLPKEHRGLPLSFRATPLIANRHSKY